MNRSRWSVLVFVACVGACRGPAGTDDLAAAGGGGSLQGAVFYGDQCDILVRPLEGHPGLIGGWPKGGSDFVLRPKSDAEWVNPMDRRSIKFLSSSQNHRVSIDSSSGVVTIGDTQFAVARYPLPFSGAVQGAAVDTGGARADEVILWLMIDGFAYEVVIRDL